MGRQDSPQPQAAEPQICAHLYAMRTRQNPGISIRAETGIANCHPFVSFDR